MSNNTHPPTQSNNNQGHTIIVKQSESNGAGTAGFVLALISLFFGWIPFIGWIIWFLGLVLSFIGIFKRPRGLAIAGLIISILDLIILLVFFAGLAILGSAASVQG